MKPNVCKHCQAVDKHFSFQCPTQRKPIRRNLIEEAGVHLKTIEDSQKKIRNAINKVSPNDLPKLLREAERVFNAFIRKRDSFNGRFICISCDKEMDIKLAQCGHFYPKTFSYLRFNEDNCHNECITCNCIDANHLVGYAVNLENKIGSERFKTLELEKSTFIKWDREELQSIINKYK